MSTIHGLRGFSHELQTTLPQMCPDRKMCDDLLFTSYQWDTGSAAVAWREREGDDKHNFTFFSCALHPQ